MEESFEHPVYSINVIEFVTVGREFCNWLESFSEQSREEFLDTSLKILPLLYLKANMLPKTEPILDDFVERFVTEEEYDQIRLQLKMKMGGFDEYLEVFTDEMRHSDIPLSSTVSENLADIYQDIKDFLMNYRLAITDIMNDALAEVINHFETYWGQSLVNVLRALHQVRYGNEDLGDYHKAEDPDNMEERKTGHWFISRMQREWDDDDNKEE